MIKLLASWVCISQTKARGDFAGCGMLSGTMHSSRHKWTVYRITV